MLPFLAMMLAGLPAADEPAITIEAAPNGYAMTIGDFAAADSQAVVLRQRAAGQQRCGKLKVRWGKFSYTNGADTKDGEARATIVNARQKFSCIDPATDPYKPAPAGWTASAKDNADVRATAARYMKVFDSADAATGIPLMEPMLEVSRAEWLAPSQAFRSIAGSGSRTFGTPLWAINNEDYAHPGAFATITFRGSYSNLAAYCGMLVFYRRAPGNYLVSQQSFQVITRANVAAGEISESGARDLCRSYGVQP